MLRSNAKSYDEIRGYLDTIPVIDTHEHYPGIVKPVEDTLSFIANNNYYCSDIMSAMFEMEERALTMLRDKDVPVEERFELLKKIDARTGRTSYSKAILMGLKTCWGIDEITLDSLQEMKRLFDAGRDQAFYERMIDGCGIKAKIVNWNIKPFVQGKSDEYSQYCKFAFSLPEHHNIHTKADITRLEEFLGHKITCLDDYLEAFENYLKKSIDFGVVCIKDQTAYRRAIRYTNPSRADAEKVFNEIIDRPRDTFGDGQGAWMLDDWLFHHFMRLARKYDLPVQIHTGHLAWIRNDIANANAVNLTSVFELHQDVRFDLFHGNWPYMDEYLFLGKNFPNVWLNLCWAQAIDPLYSIELMKRAVMTVPQSKLMAFGGDTVEIEWVVGYLTLARDNVACALSELVDSGWMSMQEARQVAADWFFNNPNELFKLGFEPFRP